MKDAGTRFLSAGLFRELAAVLSVVFIFILSAEARDYPAYRVESSLLPAAEGFYVYPGEGFSWQKPTSFRIGWDDECLRIKVRSKEPFNHLLDPSADNGDNLWNDDSIEVFVSPDGEGYFQFIVNSAGARWNGRDGVKSEEIWDWEAVAGISGDYWTAEIRLPFQVLGADAPAEGDEWMFNIGRNAPLGPARERYSSWAPVERGFGDAARFAAIIFRGEAEDAGRVKALEDRLGRPYREFFEERMRVTDELTPVRNRIFEEGLSGWGLRGRERVSIDEATSTIGSQSILLDGELEPGEAPVFIHATQAIELAPGTRYVLRADIKRSRASENVRVDVIERDSPDDSWTYHHCGRRMAEGDEPGRWGRYETRFTTSENLHHARLMLYNINSGAAAWYDNIQLFEDDGTIDEEIRPRAAKTLAFELETRDASARVILNGEETGSTGSFSGSIREGLNVIAVEGRKEGHAPGIRLRLPGHPETDGRWLASAEEPAAAWVTRDFDDRGWDRAESDGDGYKWPERQTEKVFMRQVVLWNRGHDGPDRCINPLAREWGISKGTAETLFKAVYSPFPFPVEDYEFIFEVPAEFRLLDFMHEDGRHPLNTLPSGVSEEKVIRGGREYRKYRIAFPANRMYAREGNIISRYLLLPVFLEEGAVAGEKTAWYYRREAKGNFTELQQRIPVRILPPLDGRMLENVMISQYRARPWIYSQISPEHLDRHMKDSFAAGVNTWILAATRDSENEYDQRIKDAVLEEENGRVVLWTNYPFHGVKERGHAARFNDRFLYRWLEETPEARARYWKDSDSWDTRGQYCPTYALGEGSERFYEEVLANYSIKVGKNPEEFKGWPGASIIWSNVEDAPWAGASIYRRPPDGRGSWCFCGLCKENFREWAGLPGDADLSDENIFNTYREKWHSFRSYLDGELAEPAMKAANELGRDYMIYTWMAHKDYLAALKDNIDLAFVGYPGNSVADSFRQTAIDREAEFLREQAGFGRYRVMGQRFSFHSRYAWLPAQDHEEFWRKWTILSESGYVEPRSWKTQILRTVAGFGKGVDIESAMECVAGMLYWIGEATRIIAEYEEIFYRGERADELAESGEISYPDLLVLRKGDERVVLLFNEKEEPVEVALKNRKVSAGQRAEVFERGISTDNPGRMELTVPPKDVAVVHIR